MSIRMRPHICYGALVLSAISPAYAHHAMDYQLPATFVEGLLSGLGHPVIGIDHLFFIVGAGVLAARFERGWQIALLFVAASLCAAAARVGGAPWEMSELWIAGSLIVLGAIAFRPPARAVLGMLFIAAGLLHGYALAAAIVGAEATPLYAYFAGLAVVQCAIALAAWTLALAVATRRPAFPLARLVGTAVGIAGVVFAAMIATG